MLTLNEFKALSNGQRGYTLGKFYRHLGFNSHSTMHHYHHLKEFGLNHADVYVFLMNYQVAIWELMVPL